MKDIAKRRSVRIVKRGNIMMSVAKAPAKIVALGALLGSLELTRVNIVLKESIST